MTLFEMKQKLYALQQERNNHAKFLAEKASDPTIKMEEIKEKQAQMEELDERIAILQKAHDEEEEAQRTAVASKGGTGTGVTEEEALIHAKAKFYRAALTGAPTAEIRKLYSGLGAIPAQSSDLGNGEHLLPSNISSELLVEPLEDNPLRLIELVSNITGLEEQKLSFTIEDEDLADVLDTETAKEIEVSGSSIAYGRFKSKIVATIKDTVLHGSDHDLVTEVENAIRSGLAVKEKINAFRATSDTTHDHMSFYLNSIKVVKGATLIQAILDAWADLPEAFSNNAVCVMRKQDYYADIKELTNGSDTLFGKKPEDVLGIPVYFCDRATKPIIGDFRFARQNYDIGTIFETDKDAKKGEYYFVLTAWGDHQIRLKSAFRIAEKEGGSRP